MRLVDDDDIRELSYAAKPFREIAFPVEVGVTEDSQIAKVTGGQYLENLEGYVPAREVSSLPLAPWLALLALLIFMIELAWRRFRS